MKKVLTLTMLVLLLSACSNHDLPKPSYDYVKIMTFRDVYPGDAYNKGQGIWSALYYNPNSDSVILRKGLYLSDDSVGFTTYVGQFKNSHYTDTIARLIAFLKNYKEGDLSYEKLLSYNAIYDGSNFSVEYSINGQHHFISFIISKHDILYKFDDFFYRMQKAKWDKKIVPNNHINEAEEVVHMLKGLGTYDSLIYTPPYIPPPCEKGINMELLYGRWRTVGSIYGNGKQQYKINTVEKDGSWVLKSLHGNELTLKYSGKILSIGEDHIIKVKSKDGTANLKVLNLTENCFEFMPVGADSNQIWQLYRMK